MPRIDYKERLPDAIPTELNVYSTERPRYDQRFIISKMRDLKIAERYHYPHGRRRVRLSPEFRYVENWRIAKQGPFTLAVNSLSGAINYRDEQRHGREFDKRFQISERRLTTIARKFIDDSKLIMQKATELNVNKITYLRTQGASTDGQVTAEEILDAGVIFSREIDNVPVYGFGGNMMVNIAHDETVVAASKIWRHKDKKIEKAKVLTPDFANKELEKRITRRKITSPVNVIKADFGYYEAGPRHRQNYLEPAYGFVYETKVGNFMYKSVEIIPAIEKPRQRWGPRRRFRDVPTKAQR